MAGRLRAIFPSKADKWLTSSGFNTEEEFWKSLASLSSGTVNDYMNDYLDSLNYPGTMHDKLRRFLIDQTNFTGSMFDMANIFFDSPWSGGGTAAIKDDSGNIIRDDSGNIVRDGS